MANNIEELHSEIQRLQNLVISLLLRNIELDPPKNRRDLSSAVAENLLEESEMCFRYTKLPGVKKEIAESLERAGNELMAKAVEIETTIQRDKWKK